MARGGGARSPIAVMDRFFYSVPGLKQIAEYITQSSKPLEFDELVEHFERLVAADLVVFPEGSNCFFGDAQELQPFRSSRFVEIAILTATPLLLCVHRGSENWGRSFSIDASWLDRVPLPAVARGFLETRLKENGILTVPSFPAPMPLFQMNCELYYPERKHLSEDRETRRQQVLEESQLIHEKMAALLHEIDEDMKDQI